MWKKFVNILFKIINIILVIASVALLFIAIFKKDWMELFIEWMKVFVNGLGYWNYLLLTLSSCIETLPVLGILFPGQNIILIVSGFLIVDIETGLINYNLFFIALLLTSIGAIAGNYIGYWLGKKYGDSFFDKYGFRFGITKTDVKYLKIGIEKWGAFGITFGKFHPLTRSFLPFIAGSMGMKNRKFMIYNAIGSIFRSLSMILFGVIFASYYKFLIDHAGTISIIILVLVGGYIYFFKKKEFIKYWNEKNEELEKKFSNNNIKEKNDKPTT